MRTTSRIFVLLAMWAVAGVASAQNLVQNPSFETPAQVGWTGLLSNVAFVAWVDDPATPPTTAGVNGVNSDQINTSSQILYQDVVLPSTGSYTFRIDGGCIKLGGNVFDFCRIDITNTNAATIVLPTPGTDTLATTGGNVLQTLLATDATTADATQVPLTATFNGTAGQTVRIRFMVQATTGPMRIQLDNVSLLAAGVRAVPTLSPWSLVLLSLLVGFGGLAMRQRLQR